MTIIEVVIAITMFAIMAGGIAGTLIQMRKMGESNIRQATAQVIAQGIIEQLQFVPYDTLSMGPSVSIKFVGVTSSNLSSIQDFTLTWAPDADTYTAIGEVTGGVTKGIVLDADYQSGGVTLRPKRYMRMNVNLRRFITAGTGNMSVILTYQWELTDRAGSGPVFITKEIRLVRSFAPSY
jgi:hypothetical protein